MKTGFAVTMGVLMVMGLLSDERQFALAARRWERDRSLPNLLHLATSGFFLAEDAAALR